jgi:hypothetical protein
MNRFGGAIVLGAISAAAAVGAVVGFLAGSGLMGSVGNVLRLALRRVGRNLLENGGFEGHPGGATQKPLDGGATDIPKWGVVGSQGTQTIAWTFEEHTGMDPAEGRNFIDLTNTGHSKGPYGGVEQLVSLIPDADYELTLQVGGKLDRSGPQVKVRVEILPMGPSEDFTVQMNSNGFKTWERRKMEFVAPMTPPGTLSKVFIHAPVPQTNLQGQPSKLIAIDDAQLYRLSPFLRG